MSNRNNRQNSQLSAYLSKPLLLVVLAIFGLGGLAYFIIQYAWIFITLGVIAVIICLAAAFMDVF